jgi:hypothetical protein
MLSATIGFIVNRPLNFIDPSGNLQYFLLEIFPVVFGAQMWDVSKAKVCCSDLKPEPNLKLVLRAIINPYLVAVNQFHTTHMGPMICIIVTF